jgi:hypothetical protein
MQRKLFMPLLASVRGKMVRERGRGRGEGGEGEKE